MGHSAVLRKIYHIKIFGYVNNRNKSSLHNQVICLASDITYELIKEYKTLKVIYRSKFLFVSLYLSNIICL